MTSPAAPSQSAGQLSGPRSLKLRIWHWLNALVILGLLSTVLLRKTFLSWRTNSAFIETTLAEAGHTVGPDLAKEIAVGIRAPMWEWHYIFGFALVALIVGRIILGFLRDEPSTFSAIPSFWRAEAGNRPPLHYMVVKVIYSLFYLAVLMMVVSGLTMYFHAELGLTDELRGQIKDVHEPMVWFFAAFVVVHVSGVVIAENRDEPGIVSDMLNGGE